MDACLYRPQDFLTVDQGITYGSDEMKNKCATTGITLQEAPIKTTGKIGTVERYHVLLRSAYERIRNDLYRETSETEFRTMADDSVNGTVRMEGLCETLLVF